VTDTLLQPRFAWDTVAQSGRFGHLEGPAGVRAHLVTSMSLALVMPAPGQTRACLERLAAAYGSALTACTNRRRAHTPGLDLLWSGPDRYLACMPATDDIETELGRVCGPAAAVVDQSDGRFLLRLSGPGVRKTLAKGFTIDLHPRAFAVNDTALTLLSHLSVQLTWVDETPTFEMVAPRAAAGDVWAWLEASAAEFGLELTQGS